MMLLDYLKIITGWKNIYIKNGILVIKFSIKDIPNIKNLYKNSQCFFLGDKRFNRRPIQFIVTDERYETDENGEVNVIPIITNYWTLGENLHREDGPAKIQFSPTKNTYVKSWFWNGVLHRNDYSLPIIETVYDSKIKEFHHSHISEISKAIEYKWNPFREYFKHYQNDSFTINQFDIVSMEEIHRITNATTGLLDSISDESFSLTASTYYAKMINNNILGISNEMNLSLISITIADLKQNYTNGKLNYQDGFITKTLWMINNEQKVGSLEVNNLIQNNYLYDINLFGGPFIINDMMKMEVVSMLQ